MERNGSGRPPAPYAAAGQSGPTDDASPGDVVAYRDADAVRRKRIERAIAEIDMGDTSSILFFGTRAQEQLTSVSDDMLEGVRNKDVGPAGSALNEMLTTLRGFDVSKLGLKDKPGLLARALGRGKPLASFVQRYEEVRKQIDAISDRLDSHKTRLMTDVAQLDRLYAANLDYFHQLADYIAAGDEKLRQLDSDIVPAVERKAQLSGDVLDAQALRDLRGARDDLERRVHDLKLTRQVAMQSLPSIRLVQENDKSLIGKITSTLANTVPLWRQQLAQAVTIFRSREAGRTLKEATDLTNELLLANAENLKQANIEVRTQVERGVFDIAAVKKANDFLIATIEDSLRIADQARRNRAEAEGQLRSCEADLRRVLAAARPQLPAVR